MPRLLLSPSQPLFGLVTQHTLFPVSFAETLYVVTVLHNIVASSPPLAFRFWYPVCRNKFQCFECFWKVHCGACRSMAKFPVKLYVYDLSRGMERQLSPFILGKRDNDRRLLILICEKYPSWNIFQFCVSHVHCDSAKMRLLSA